MQKNVKSSPIKNGGGSSYLYLSALFLFGLVLGGGVDRAYSVWAQSEAAVGSLQVRGNTKYTYINPLLECEVARGSLDSRKQNFGNELTRFVDNLKDQGKASEIAVYYRDLNNGPTLGVNEEKTFIPASLLKVPVMMSYYKLAETDPSILNRKLTLTEAFPFPNEGNTQLIKPAEEIAVGKSYTVSELIEYAIKYSDNQAVALLVTNMPDGPLHELYYLLGIDDSSIMAGNAQLSVKNYAAFFRILFNSSFLDDLYSEKALKLLSEIDFEDGLVAGLPSGMIVSHKFGESGYLTGERQLHDCGITYFPDHPYLLCVMSRGKTVNNLKDSIKEVSAFVYQKVDEQY